MRKCLFLLSTRIARFIYSYHYEYLGIWIAYPSGNGKSDQDNFNLSIPRVIIYWPRAVKFTVAIQSNIPYIVNGSGLS